MLFRPIRASAIPVDRPGFGVLPRQLVSPSLVRGRVSVGRVPAGLLPDQLLQSVRLFANADGSASGIALIVSPRPGTPGRGVGGEGG